GGEVRLRNVDLRECRLAGNNIAPIEFNETQWGRRFGRNVLFDETLARCGTKIPFHSVRETYQILKQKYHERGDHATAGDFQYGEMEMKRRAYGWPRRVLCPEFLYWAASGFGTDYVRAFLVLVLLVVAFAGLYWWTSRATFGNELLDALRFSIG